MRKARILGKIFYFLTAKEIYPPHYTDKKQAKYEAFHKMFTNFLVEAPFSCHVAGTLCRNLRLSASM